MADKKNFEEERDENTEKETTKAYFYVALTAIVLSVVAFGLSFTVLGVYSLICAVLLALASLSFLNTQKNKNNFPAVKILKTVAYAALVIYLALFAGGIAYSALSNG